MPFHIQKMSKILQHIHTISPLCINMIVVLLIILLNLMMLPKESKNKATIEQKKNTNWLKITSISSFTLKWFKAHSTLMFEEIIFFFKVCTTSNGTEMRWMKLSMIRERNGVTGCNQCDIYTYHVYDKHCPYEWVDQSDRVQNKNAVKCTLLTLLNSASILLSVLICSTMHIL